uniref:diacylglycerol O-acyltransferase n=1 Tax=Callorhinchus milii TaxID=7868 RepID=A0A4W3H5G2_CALMI
VAHCCAYGFLVDPVNIVAFLLSDPYTWPAPYMINFICIRLNIILYKSGHTFQMSNLAVILILPLFVLNVLTSATAGGSMMVLIVYSILLLKLYSYHEVNKWLREEWYFRMYQNRRIRGHSSKSEFNSINCHSWSQSVIVLCFSLDLYYFLLAPTLCYQMNFPRSPKIRMRFLLRRILEMVRVICFFIQYRMKITFEIDCFRLQIPNHFIWIVFFYGFFHSTLNFIAELMQFADRRFYRDWWNSQTLTYYWSNSNMLLHKWSVRHIYRPMIENGYTKWEGQASVFVLSALFHEYLIAVPFRMLRLWLFTGMMLQVLIAWVLSRYLKGLYGNAIVWLCIILGPPLGVLTYIHDYYVFEQLKINQNK